VTYLVDANILSEPTKPSPDAKVMEWLQSNESEIAVDPIILGELLFGILLLPHGYRKQRLQRWFDEGARKIVCLPWEAATGLRWAALLASLRGSANAMPVKDSMIAATALHYNLILATRNERDFAKAGVQIINPFIS
jgi:toxin FitB